MDSEAKFKKIEYFTSFINQILVISSGGIAAGVAFLQIDKIAGTAVTATMISLGAFVISLIAGVVSLTVIIGQADAKKPDFNQRSVRFPSLLTFITFAVGISSFLVSGIALYMKDEVVKSVPVETPQKITCPEVVVPKNEVSNSLLNEYFSNLSLEQQLQLTSFFQKNMKIVEPPKPKSVKHKPSRLEKSK